MDERVSRDEEPRLERLETRVDGGAFRRPPVLPIVAVVALLFGLSLGVGLVPKPVEPTPAPSASVASAVPAPTVSAAPLLVDVTASPADLHSPSLAAIVTSTPPKQGTTTAQAVAAAEKTFGIKAADVVSIRLVDGTTYPPAVVGWVWEIVVRGPGQVECGHVFVYPKPLPSYSPEPIYCEENADIVIVDFKSGEAMLMGSF